MSESKTFDVVIMGGGMAGSLMAISILRNNPSARIAIVEQSPMFHKKVGESTSDVTAIFLRRFDVDSILSKQIKKTGLRFLFNSKNNQDPANCSDFSSPSLRSVANGYQLNRGLFDEDLLWKAQEMGVKVYRPAEVVDWNYEAFNSEVDILQNGKQTKLKARWLVDASGRKGLVANRNGWREMSKAHPTASSWAHFSNVVRLDDVDKNKTKWWNKHCIGSRQFATSHILDKGYWVWYIPLQDETVSVGIVYDQRLINTEKRHPREHFFEFIKEHPILNKVVSPENAHGFRHLPYLPYLSKKYSLPGLALVGDAAAFLDPLFSPGMEFTSQQVLWLGPLIAKDIATEKYDVKAWWRYEKRFSDAFRTRFNLYVDRYFLMGDYRLFGLLTQLDTAGYYNTTIIPAALFPNYLKNVGYFPRWLSWVYNKIKYRLISLAEKRFQEGIVAEENLNGQSFSHACIPGGISVLWRGSLMMSYFILRYLRLEWDMFWALYMKKRSHAVNGDSEASREMLTSFSR